MSIFTAGFLCHVTRGQYEVKMVNIKYRVAGVRIALNFRFLPTPTQQTAETYFCTSLYWYSGSVCDIAPDLWPSVPLGSCVSWGQSGGAAGNKPVVVRYKDNSPLARPRDRERRWCRDWRSNSSEGMEEGAEGCPLIGFTVTQWTMEQVEAEREGQQSEREVRVVYWMVPGETRQGNPLSLKLGGVILEPSLNKAKPL